ncbi:receptor-like protein kinase herk 1 [Nicotiana attenuata]|uniref:Receptor-like protein kinase herk 1 n=1 Tax=Nicotiana attenuata TaxID=49451 RepID=A0A1J6IIV0_NICAT|nr:receptor-like protein kinase herk 1 [Nicotiana attenuata]
MYAQALETVARVNMGGSLVSFENDTLWRTCFLTQRSSAKSINKIASVKYPQDGATPDIAPQQIIYGTCSKMNAADTGDDPNANFKVIWTFNVEPGFQYFIRLHFYDIKVQGFLATASFNDYVTPPAKSNRLNVSVGPSPWSGFLDAFLNGLELLFSTMELPHVDTEKYCDTNRIGI